MCFYLNYINLKRNSASDGSFDVNTSVRGIGEVKMTSTYCCIPLLTINSFVGTCLLVMLYIVCYCYHTLNKYTNVYVYFINIYIMYHSETCTILPKLRTKHTYTVNLLQRITTLLIFF